MCGWHDDKGADSTDAIYLGILFLCCGILWVGIGAVTDGTLAAWLLTLRLPAGW